MRKLAIILVVAFITVCSFRTEQKLNVSLSLQQWQAILAQLDNSSAPHNEVKITSGWIVEQLQPQLKADTTKKK